MNANRTKIIDRILVEVLWNPVAKMMRMAQSVDAKMARGISFAIYDNKKDEAP